jgi:hypothetical protein
MRETKTIDSCTYWQDEYDGYYTNMQGWFSAGATLLAAGTMLGDFARVCPEKSPFPWQTTLAVSVLGTAFSMGMATWNGVYAERVSQRARAWQASATG